MARFCNIYGYRASNQFPKKMFRAHNFRLEYHHNAVARALFGMFIRSRAIRRHNKAISQSHRLPADIPRLRLRHCRADSFCASLFRCNLKQNVVLVRISSDYYYFMIPSVVSILITSAVHDRKSPRCVSSTPPRSDKNPKSVVWHRKSSLFSFRHNFLFFRGLKLNRNKYRNRSFVDHRISSPEPRNEYCDSFIVRAAHIMRRHCHKAHQSPDNPAIVHWILYLLYL